MTKRNKILISAAVNPNIAEVVLDLRPFPRPRRRVRSRRSRAKRRLARSDEQLDETVAGVIVQKPNYFGIVEDLRRRRRRSIHANGSVMIESCDISTLAVLKTPAADGADIASRRLPGRSASRSRSADRYLGYLATKKPHVRQDAGPHRRPVVRQERQARLRAHPAGPRTAHPPREGQFQHLLEPVPDGALRDHLPVA
ncbi:MAG: hypothetical protein MZU97_12765 [Bacillus subtilis]|nr:hypothetical protein [Bacillus subtilis]